jgi:hypothetical protein
MLAWISGWNAYTRLQSGCASKENQYRCERTSQLAPGYVLSRQVPPTASEDSRITNERWPAWGSRIPMPSPPSRHR